MDSYSMDPIQAKNQSTISTENLASNDAISEKSKPKGLKRIIVRFFHYTTINGLQRLASSKTIIGRLFWVLVLLGATIMFSRDIYKLVQQYRDRPVSVVAKIEYFRKMRFPAITVCNVNRIRKNSTVLKSSLEKTLEQRANNTCFREDLRQNNKKCEEDKDELKEFRDEINHILSTTHERKLVKSGHHRAKFIIECRFNGIRCRNSRYWTQFWDPEFGNCFTFNSRLASGHVSRNVSLFDTDKVGSVYGLRLAFNLELNEYIPELTTDAGVKLTITEPSEMPFPIYHSLSLSPGFHSEIALKRIQIKRIDRFSNGSCRVDSNLSENNPYRKRFNATYSVQACLQDCYARSQVLKCGCAEYSLFTATPKDKTCDETDKAKDQCIKEWKDIGGTCENQCRDLCSETVYESSMTSTQWPSSTSVETVLNTLGIDYRQYDEDFTKVRNNFLAANIFFQRFRESRVEESLSYETANLLADIGGQIGLWAGLSVISMCELLELIALLLRDFFLQRKTLASR